jgi:hypothetical protein
MAEEVTTGAEIVLEVVGQVHLPAEIRAGETLEMVEATAQARHQVATAEAAVMEAVIHPELLREVHNKLAC